MGTCKADPLLAGVTPWAAPEQLEEMEDAAVVDLSLQLITGFGGAGTAASSVITLLMPVTCGPSGAQVETGPCFCSGCRILLS